MRRFALRLAAASAAGFLTVGLGAPAGAMPLVQTKAVFNEPGGSPEIMDELIDLIEGAEAGSSIRLTSFHIRHDDVVTKLIEADDRGVAVNVIGDGREADEEQYQRLEKELGTDTGERSWVNLCAPDNACIGDKPDEDGKTGAVMHSKFVLFSHTMNTRNVLMLTTANLSKTMGGSGGWNSAYIDVGNHGLYEQHQQYFNDLAAAANTEDDDKYKDTNYYDTRRPEVFDNAKTYFFPRAKEEGKSTDTVVNILDGVSCLGTQTDVRVSNWWLGRTAVAEKLKQMSRFGCNVEVVVNNLAFSSCKALSDDPDSDTLEVRTFRNEDRGAGNHQKNMMIDGHYLGRDTKVTFTGSHNLVPSSLRENDENMVRIYGSEIHDEFVANFEDVKEAAKVEVPADASDRECQRFDPNMEIKRGEGAKRGKKHNNPQPKKPEPNDPKPKLNDPRPIG